MELERVVGETGARGRAATVRAASATPPPPTASTEETGPDSREDFDALVTRRLAACEQAEAARAALLEPQVAARVDAVVAWPAGRRCPLGRLREAWVAQRYGLAKVVESGSALAGPVRPGLAAVVGRAIELYERYAARRPPGWPASGPGALCALAGLHGAERFGGDVARLLGLAKAMRAVALEHDRTRLARARARALARRAPPTSRLVFRLSVAPRVETAEARRCRVRDAVLLGGRDPAAWPNAALALAHLAIAPAADEVRLLEPDRFEELDGIGARATRYRAELARGHWQLPHPAAVSCAHCHPTPEEGSP